ncbi:hypothetical protein B8V81_1432 [Paenibacillus pasadenensis]|uniref:Uncharacterized protein n=1 Tax=Paenibacillus pasadenensis TaxID=217090 RepID=A0A2N5NA72_9BACL|nr:hypothetical protein B8V81_1432 [Paenibacillus pasadenensis]
MHPRERWTARRQRAAAKGGHPPCEAGSGWSSSRCLLAGAAVGTGFGLSPSMAFHSFATG